MSAILIECVDCKNKKKGTNFMDYLRNLEYNNLLGSIVIIYYTFWHQNSKVQTLNGAFTY